MSSAVFSEAWHRVADARVGLLSSAKVQRQEFGGKLWYVIRDVYTQRYFRVTPEAYAFLSRLDPARTVEEVWLEFVRERPEQAPGQEEVVRLLSQLHLANLLYFRSSPDSQAIFRRSRSQRRRELLAKLMAFLFWRIYLWNPDRWLDRLRGPIRVLTGPAALVVWLVVVFHGAHAAIENWDELFDRTQGLFSLSNLPWLYVCLAVMKLLHEAGHAFVCKRYGGEVHAFGVMFLVFTPLPYVDMSAAWSFGSRLRRVYVGLAGMMVELFLAAIAAMVWAGTGPGLVNSLAFNVMVIGSVSSLLFNGNPLLRFDAYYILSDLIDIPNLYQRAQQHWLYLGDRWLLGTRSAESPATDRRERIWFTVYGLAAFLYRLLITLGILFFVLDQWFEVGLVLAVVTLITMVFMPLRKLVSHLFGARVQENRLRARLTVAGIVAVLLGAGAWVPLPYSIEAPGVLQAHESSMLHAVAGGTLVKLAARNGQVVRAGDVIAELSNPDIDYEQRVVLEDLRAAELLYRNAAHNMPADLVPMQKRIAALDSRLGELKALKEQLVVRAPHEGEWVAPMLHELQGAWVAQGETLGEVVRNRRLRFVAVVRQEQADELFRQQHAGGKLRLTGQADHTILISEFVLIPHQRQRLSSSALGWAGGGEIATRPDDPTGEVAAEPFFELHALLPEMETSGLRVAHGLSGTLRVPLEGRSLFWRMRKAFMQLLQKRYGISAGRLTG